VPSYNSIWDTGIVFAFGLQSWLGVKEQMSSISSVKAIFTFISSMVDFDVEGPL
jgi:hypothetical protein